MFYSAIIPVYERPDEINELLDSLCHQTYKNFEVVVVDDGSKVPCQEIVESYSDRLDIKYFYKTNSGQGFSRNYGFDKATGDYFVVFDSDCLIPANYFEIVNNHLKNNWLDAYGGPDRAHENFTPIQKAISYSMTSPFTTGGIRGNKHHAGTFHPRSFNMGISKEVFDKTGGYKITRMGEDIEFSLRIIETGFKTGLIPDAFVYHKRRTNFIQFFKQLQFFGRARINISRFYPAEIKLVHSLPALFVISLALWIFSPFVSLLLFKIFSFPFLLFFGLTFIHSTIINKNIYIGILSSIASGIQIMAYGLGFMKEFAVKLKE